MSDETPILRADATDDDLQDEVPDPRDTIKVRISAGEEIIPARTLAAGFEAYENSEGGWSFRPYYR